MLRRLHVPTTLAIALTSSLPAFGQADPTGAPAAESPASASDVPNTPTVPTSGDATEASPPPGPVTRPATSGDGAAPTDGATGAIVVTTPAPAPVPMETRRIHQGFYARMSLGTGPMTTLFSDGLLEQSRVTGASSGFDVLLGGTPLKGFVVGGGLLCNGMGSEDVQRADSIRSRDAEPAIGLCALGPMVDFFPDAKRGLHVGGLLGVAALGIDAPGFDDDAPPAAAGGAIGLWVGHDWWVAREWSLGVSFRYLGIAVENPDDDWSGAADSFTLSFTALAQ